MRDALTDAARSSRSLHDEITRHSPDRLARLAARVRQDAAASDDERERRLLADLAARCEAALQHPQ